MSFPSCVRRRGRVCVCLCASHAHTCLSWRCLVLTGHFFSCRGGGGEQQHILVALSQFVAPYNLLYFFLFALPNSHQIFLVPLCIIQSKMPYLARMFCIDVLLYLHIMFYHVFVFSSSFACQRTRPWWWCVYLLKANRETKKAPPRKITPLIPDKSISHSSKHKSSKQEVTVFLLVPLKVTLVSLLLLLLCGLHKRSVGCLFGKEINKWTLWLYGGFHCMLMTPCSSSLKVLFSFLISHLSYDIMFNLPTPFYRHSAFQQ